MSLAGAEALTVPPDDCGVSEMVPLDESSRVGEARRLVGVAGRKAGLGPGEQGNLGIIVNEVASNAIRHASGGQLVVRVVAAGRRTGVELLCLDRGRGIGNVGEAMRDGFSTAGSMGTGLGAAQRIASTFEMFSTVGAGTVVLARVWREAPRPAPNPAYASICLPHPGERECGDGWGMNLAGSRAVMFAVDGLGHGRSAAEAAQTAVRLFKASAERRPSEILDRVHRGIKSTRGAAAAVAEIDQARRIVRYAGIGNIAGWVMAEGSLRAVTSHPGILGHSVRKIQEFEYPLPPDGVVVLHSDGLTNRWKPDPYPGLLRRDVATVAGVIYRDSVRERDDSLILVFRVASEAKNAVR